MKTIEHWIAGKPTPGVSDRTTPVFNPATGEQRAEVLLAPPADVDAAIAAASDAFGEWSQTSLSRRTKVLFAFRELVNPHAGEIAELITDEHGKVLSDALGEVQRGLEVVEFACGIPTLLKGEYSDQVSTGVDTFSFREPLGVVAGITPFNFPAMVPMWMFPVAIACGNTFVLKPSERCPRHRCGSPSCGRRPVSRTACSTSCTATSRRSTRSWTRPTSLPSRSSGRRPSRSTSTSGPPPPASGSRRWAAPRTTRSSCRTPTWTSPQTTWPRPRSGPRVSGAWRSPLRSP